MLSFRSDCPSSSSKMSSWQTMVPPTMSLVVQRTGRYWSIVEASFPASTRAGPRPASQFPPSQERTSTSHDFLLSHSLPPTAVRISATLHAPSPAPVCPRDSPLGPATPAVRSPPQSLATAVSVTPGIIHSSCGPQARPPESPPRSLSPHNWAFRIDGLRGITLCAKV